MCLYIDNSFFHHDDISTTYAGITSVEIVSSITRVSQHRLSAFSLNIMRDLM